MSEKLSISFLSFPDVEEAKSAIEGAKSGEPRGARIQLKKTQNYQENNKDLQTLSLTGFISERIILKNDLLVFTI